MQIRDELLDAFFELPQYKGLFQAFQILDTSIVHQRRVTPKNLRTSLHAITYSNQ